jgi:hypothetical protein
VAEPQVRWLIGLWNIFHKKLMITSIAEISHSNRTTASRPSWWDIPCFKNNYLSNDFSLLLGLNYASSKQIFNLCPRVIMECENNLQCEGCLFIMKYPLIIEYTCIAQSLLWVQSLYKKKIKYGFGYREFLHVAILLAPYMYRAIQLFRHII